MRTMYSNTLCLATLLMLSLQDKLHEKLRHVIPARHRVLQGSCASCLAISICKAQGITQSKCLCNLSWNDNTNSVAVANHRCYTVLMHLVSQSWYHFTALQGTGVTQCSVKFLCNLSRNDNIKCIIVVARHRALHGSCSSCRAMMILH